jgi:hypothetical protein
MLPNTPRTNFPSGGIGLGLAVMTPSDEIARNFEPFKSASQIRIP